MNPLTTIREGFGGKIHGATLASFFAIGFAGMLIGYGVGIDAMVTDLFAYAAATILILFAFYNHPGASEIARDWSEEVEQ